MESGPLLGRIMRAEVGVSITTSSAYFSTPGRCGFRHAVSEPHIAAILQSVQVQAGPPYLERQSHQILSFLLDSIKLNQHFMKDR
jgi:hypothetical protein